MKLKSHMVTCVYLPQFPAWAEQYASRQSFIAVYAKGQVIARTPDLASLAIGEDLGRARALFPYATFCAHDPRRDSALWEHLLYLLSDSSPHLTSVREGLALMEVWDENPIVSSLRAKTGSAPTRFVAILAALQASPDSPRHVEPRSLRGFLEQTPTNYLVEFGCAADMLERLNLFGLTTLGRLYPLTRQHFHLQFGEEGVLLYRLLHPECEDTPIPIFQPPQSVKAHYNFEQPAHEPAELSPVLHHLVGESVTRLRSCKAHLITLWLNGRERQVQRYMLKEPSSDTRIIGVAAARMMDAMLNSNPIEQMQVELGGLVESAGMQEWLFKQKVYEAVATIHRRFPGILLKGKVNNPGAYLWEDRISFEPFPGTPQLRLKRR